VVSGGRLPDRSLHLQLICDREKGSAPVLFWLLSTHVIDGRRRVRSSVDDIPSFGVAETISALRSAVSLLAACLGTRRALGAV
jgi:hypothetical protein